MRPLVPVAADDMTLEKHETAPSASTGRPKYHFIAPQGCELGEFSQAWVAADIFQG